MADNDNDLSDLAQKLARAERKEAFIVMGLAISLLVILYNLANALGDRW